MLRLLGVPLFLWLLLGPHADGWALLVLALSGFTDWADGVLARSSTSVSRLGALLDPLADRLYILATLRRPGAAPHHPAVAGGRDRRPRPGPGRRAARAAPARATRRLQVHYLGKAATFCLLYAFPLLLLGAHHGTLADDRPADRLGVHDLGDRAVPVGRRALPAAGRAPCSARR